MRYFLIIVLLVAGLVTAGCVSENQKTVVIPTQTPKPATIIPTPTSTPTVPIPTITLCVKKCNGLCYDPGKMTCCYGSLAEGNWNIMSSGCYNEKGDLFCGGKIYPNKSNLNDNWCCGGKLWDRSGNDNQGCCSNYSTGKWGEYSSDINDGILFDGTNQHCCNGKIEPGGPWKGWINCGNTCYNSRTQTCFKDVIYEGDSRNCGSDLLCPFGMRCCDDKDKGPTCYNPKTHYCQWGPYRF